MLAWKNFCRSAALNLSLQKLDGVVVVVVVASGVSLAWSEVVVVVVEDDIGTVGAPSDRLSDTEGVLLANGLGLVHAIAPPLPMQLSNGSTAKTNTTASAT